MTPPERQLTGDGFARRFDLPFADDAIGYEQTTDEVGRVDASAELLGQCFAAVRARTSDYLAA